MAGNEKKVMVEIESNKAAQKMTRRIREQKIGQVTAMHLMIKKLYVLMTPEQRATAKEYSQALRDEMRKIEKQTT